MRSRGVMEKCTYCVQRISAAKIAGGQGKSRDPRWRDRHRLPAGLPDRAPSSSAISTIKNSQVAKIKAQQRNYGVLADLNTRPRTTYIAEVINLNPELAEARSEHAPENS